MRKKWLFLIVVIICANVLAFIIFRNNYRAEVIIASLSTTIVTSERSIEGKEGELYQFPKIGRTLDGVIYVTCSGIEHRDTTQGYEIERLSFVSKDEGNTWNNILSSDLIKADICPPNGSYFQGVVPQNSYETDLSNYTPVYTQEMLNLYYAKDIPNFKKTITFREYDPEKKAFNTFEEIID